MKFVIDPPLPKGVKIVLGIAGLVWVVLCLIASLRAQTTLWFAVKLGETTCTASKVAGTPMHVSYKCSNPYGGQTGSYTADGTGGATAPNVFMLSLNSPGPALSSPTFNPSAASCLIGINATQAAVSVGSLGIIQPNSAAYSCSGLQGGSISWP